MEILKFRIKNYKSIIDSGECRLSDNDKITVLAGQNESGKSSILQALRDFEKEKIDIDCLREDDTLPEISCTFKVSKDDFDLEDFLEDKTFPENFKKSFVELVELTITKTFNAKNECVISINEGLIEKFIEALSKVNELTTKRNEKVKSGETPNEFEVELIDIDETKEEFLEWLSSHTPKIIFFDDFCDILPEQILIKDLKGKKKDTKGYQAVKNIETILKADFTKLDEINDGRRETTQNTYHESITTAFNEKWKQRIAEGDGAKIHVKNYQGKAEDASYLKFYIETKKGEYLSAGKRSQGFKWFLSFFLHLKAEDERSKELVILFDEPGLYLHSKAQLDMIAVFEELSKNNQIIYSTHSPYLIDTTKLHRLRLVLNTKKFGTTIEKITSGKIKNQKDSLKPIIDALGLEVASPFSVAIKNNIILEGISDFHYMQGMKRLLEKEYDLGLLPSMGVTNAHLLMELCIGWSLNWLILFDDKGATKSFNNIKKNFFNDNLEETNKKIYTIKNCDGIEDIFSIGDMKLVNVDIEFSTERKNSEVVNEYGGKELFARIFYEKVLTGEITKDKLSKTAIKKFEDIFSFIESSFEIKSESTVTKKGK